MNKEGPDLFGGDGHSEIVIPRPLLFVVWRREKAKMGEGIIFVLFFFIKTESVQIYSVFLTVFQVICSFPLPPLQTGDIPGPCQRTLLHTLHFAHALQSFLFTVVKKQNKQE